jgi:hypothetical protein
MQFIHWGCVYIGYRVLWRHKLKIVDIDDTGMLINPDKGALDLPDWQGAEFGKGGGGGPGMDITSDSFRHRFFEANKPWIIQQLRQTMSPRAQLEALAKGEAFPEDFGKDQGISDDDGTDSDSDRDTKFELDPMAKAVARRWLSKTRRRLGLPDRAQGELEISSDDDSEDNDDDDGRPKPKLSQTAKEIARRWLANARNQIKDAAPGQDSKPTRGDISSDDDSDAGKKDRPIIAMSAQSTILAKLWLSKVRKGDGAGPAARRSQEISDDDSSGSDDHGNNAMVLGPKAKAIAKQWLQQVRRGGGGRPAPANDVSDDDSTSDSEAGPRASGNPPPNLSAKSKAIALAWIRNIRRR